MRIWANGAFVSSTERRIKVWVPTQIEVYVAFPEVPRQATNQGILGRRQSQRLHPVRVCLREDALGPRAGVTVTFVFQI